MQRQLGDPDQALRSRRQKVDQVGSIPGRLQYHRKISEQMSSNSTAFCLCPRILCSCRYILLPPLRFYLGVKKIMSRKVGGLDISFCENIDPFFSHGLKNVSVMEEFTFVLLIFMGV